MLTIKLSRIGKKNKPLYRLIITEKSRDPYGRALEILGFYNPNTKELNIKPERINYWLARGSQMTATVNNLLVEKNIIQGKKVKASRSGKKKKTDTPEKDSPTAQKTEDKETLVAEKNTENKEKIVEIAEKNENEKKIEEKPENKPEV